MAKKLVLVAFQFAIILLLIQPNFAFGHKNITHKGLILHEPIVIHSDSDLINFGFPGSGTEDDPYVISNIEITNQSDFGIFISNTTKYITITNCTINYVSIAIECTNVANNTIIIANSTITNSAIGLLIRYTNSTNITNNNFKQLSKVAIFVSGSYNITIENNTINNSNVGIETLYSTTLFIDNNFISHGNYGIINLATTLINVTMNLFQNNSKYAVMFDANANDSIIYFNDFVGNSIGQPSQAYDDGYNNTWFNYFTFKGNYWSNWVGIDAYPIAGAANSADTHPLTTPVHKWLKVSTFKNSISNGAIILGIIACFTILKKEKQRIPN